MDRLLHTHPQRRSGIAVWRQIAERLSEEIRNGNFAADGRLPSEGELAGRFGVNRHTLRQAVQSLQDEGLVRVERGRGMFVQHELLDYPLTRRTRFTENLQRQGLLPSQHLLTAHAEAASEKVARELRIETGERVLKIENLSEANGQPVSVMTAWYPAARFEGLLEMLQEGASTTAMLQRLGLEDYVRAESRVTSQMPSEETARLLKQPATRPLLCVASIDADLEGRPVKYGETLFCGDRVQLSVSMGDTR
ncbi:phosphonate metabolism transcriptional regulator PhnF [Ramlibacter agri]|nr:phosphonate metabolism transcriptional regulator PhnF [Ramlibacter agri]